MDGARECRDHFQEDQKQREEGWQRQGREDQSRQGKQRGLRGWQPQEERGLERGACQDEGQCHSKWGRDKGRAKNKEEEHRANRVKQEASRQQTRRQEAQRRQWPSRKEGNCSQGDPRSGCWSGRAIQLRHPRHQSHGVPCNRRGCQERRWLQHRDVRWAEKKEQHQRL